MTTKREIAPSTLSVRLAEGGVVVEYLDGREVFYHGVPEPVSDTLRTKPGKDVHVLVTDESGTEGVLLYVDDRNTADEIIEDSGVGRVLLADGEREEAFPGVVVERDGHFHEISADPAIVEGRIFVFVEDEFGEESYELVAADESGRSDATDATEETESTDATEETESTDATEETESTDATEETETTEGS